MPLISENIYHPGIFLRNGHLNTLSAYLLRSPKKPAFQRERITTPDQDFLDLDWIKTGQSRLAIILHGLEGSTSSQYIRGVSPLLSAAGYDVMAVNHRSCSGEINRQKKFYHSGFLEDFEFLLQKYASEYREAIAIGYSLGGNILLRYAGLRAGNTHPLLTKVISISAPCDLEASSRTLLRPINRLYTNNFLNTLENKIKSKAEIMDGIPVEDWKKVKNLWDFDEYFTAPLHGFKDARDYYSSCSSIRVLEDIQMPAYLISSEDDPFLTPECLPFALASKHRNFHFLPQKYGGHVGFTQDKQMSFADKMILQILQRD